MDGGGVEVRAPEGVGTCTATHGNVNLSGFRRVRQNRVTSGAIDFIDSIYRYTGLTKGNVRHTVDETTPWLEAKADVVVPACILGARERRTRREYSPQFPYAAMMEETS